MRRDPLASGLILVAIAAGWYLVHLEGPYRAQTAMRHYHLGEKFDVSRPLLIGLGDDPREIAAVSGDHHYDDGSFYALQLEPERRERPLMLNGDSGNIPFKPVLKGEGFITRVRGLCIPRPTFHLGSIPSEGTGPGFHLERSCTGWFEIVDARGDQSRILLSRWIVNSDAVPGVDGLLWRHPTQSILAVMDQVRGSWFVWFFSV